MNLLSKIKSNSFALWVAILSVVVQSFHSYTAFYNTSSLKGSGWGIAQAVLFAVVIDLAILFYTVRNKTKVALGAAFVMVVINSYYYYQHLGLSFQFIFGVFLALTIPTSVYFYSEEIKPEISEVDSDYKNEEIDRLLDRIKELTEMNNETYKDFQAEQFKVKTLDETLNNERKHFEILGQRFDEAIRLRDLAIQSESMTKQSVDKNYILKSEYNKIFSAFKKHLEEAGETIPEDKTLINIQDEKASKIISATIPEDLPNIE